jgi:molybdenum cofactor cytidylyltransferase
VNLAVVILAAGASRRMGRPKLLLPWADGTILSYLVATWRQLGAEQIAVVTASTLHLHGDSRIDIDEAEARRPLEAELDRLGIPAKDRIRNPRRESGMFSSILCAAQWTGWDRALTHWVLTLGDQPQVQLGTLRMLLDLAMHNSDKACQPARKGRPRHPVLLPRDLFAELAKTPAENLKEFLRAFPSRRVWFESGDAGLDFDLDEPADYERALKLTSFG